VPPEKTIQPNLTQDLLLQVIEQLSAVAGSVGILQGQINIVIAENQLAAQKRQAMYEKLNKIDSIESTMKRIEPLVDKHEERHNQAVGAWHFGRWIWTVIAGGAGAAFSGSAAHIRGSTPKRSGARMRTRLASAAAEEIACAGIAGR
jgi:hypothetical protein